MENQIEEKSSNKKTILIICTTIFMVFIGLICFAIYNKESSKIDMEIIKKKHNNRQNVVNDSQVDEEDLYGTDRDIADCNITYIKGIVFELKNTKANNGEISSDVYINNNFSKRITYSDNAYNKCNEIEILEIDNNYILTRFVSEIFYSTFYLFNKNGTFISDFSEYTGKYDIKYSIPFVYKSDNGVLAIDYISDSYSEATLEDSYCYIKPKLADLYSVTEYIKVENDEMKTYDTKKTTWEEEMEKEEIDLNDIICGDE